MFQHEHSFFFLGIFPANLSLQHISFHYNVHSATIVRTVMKMLNKNFSFRNDLFSALNKLKTAFDE